ncbi:hypothetical protein [Brucella anthropi]|uniref:hypothetical protein n=1 Tax=Brucella anthropi TaxID=529 RepID=UPI00244A0B1F|nr:hypothetical protein [Brucella anthropi]MDG9790528.1 hypothetical protein [Brucella anthropi]MDH0580673.1 hypothetical protein [Brucella anthropi]MDH0817297.1 hypothetical protein [Brucella anthropi]MDH2084109.1 hypothetical protein [Brucella anthropi]
MAKQKTITQAYAATLIVAGKDIPPGTDVPLPEDEARRIGDMFGVIPATNKMDASAKTRQPAPPAKTPDLDALEKAVEEARKAYDDAKGALEHQDAGDDEANAFEAAEKALDEAEAALEQALA